MKRRVQISVVGGSRCSAEVGRLARQTGRQIARAGCVLVCGGLGGVMGAAAEGARESGGLTVGILPTYDRETAHVAIDIVLPTGMGHARNVIVAGAGDAVIALPGESGTASEVALARTLRRPVVGLGAWEEFDGVVPAATPEAAVETALRLVGA